ncbi:MAG: isoleucine--tRNA ligase, partial [Thermoplasmata archaeon]|nr:isoleucine--tRNA ligase [Thermoplasmata archaeon]
MAAAGRENLHSASLPEVQARVRQYWERTGVPAKAARGTVGGSPFRFTEGPPTANGPPHIGHVISRTLKDVQLRYHRMLGEEIVSPMAGWDCHGLPVELEIEKRHGIKSRAEIEAFGVDRFCEECRASALEVASVWREMSQRVGYWLDYDRPYRTMDAPYIESVWWSLKTLFDRGLLEKGYYVLPYCPRCETPLSSHEVAQGYKETTDPSVTVRIHLVPNLPGEPDRWLLVWTTTPWTLPSNLLIAARADLTYVLVKGPDGREVLLAEPALARYFPADVEVVERFAGDSLAGWYYEPLFPFAGAGPGRYRIVLDPMVDASEGTGLVHIAPSFGVEDQRIGARDKVGVFDPLDSRGVFTGAVPPFAGKSFKTADPLIVAALRERAAVEKEEKLRHTYPFCWRCQSALIYRAIDSWFVRTSRFTSSLTANNRTVRWLPAHMRDGRFGNFLTEAKDWALSRNRYWGTPLPIWLCPKGHGTCVGSFGELSKLSGAALPPSFDPHRVTVDRIAFPCPKCGEASRREPYTIDGWYDSGASPFAQYHYPFEPGPFRPETPLDFIAEGLDQTRGWFYTLLVLSTLLFDRPAYRTCVVNGLVLDDTGQKMSKSRGNAVEPMGLLERQGGDAVRWAFVSVDYTEPVRLTEESVRHAGARSLGTLLNVLAFYRANALADRLRPAEERPDPASVLDRWLLSRLAGTAQAAGAALGSYDARPAAIAFHAFIDDLSTWYLRRSRPRFWSEEDPVDRHAANDTLSFALANLARLIAPLAPFTAEEVYQEVRGTGFEEAESSVHLSSWPSILGSRDEALEHSMADLRERVEVGRELRARAGVKARVPLGEFVLFSDVPFPFQSLGADGERLLVDELNVRRLSTEPAARASGYPEEEWVLREDGGRVVAAISRRPTAELLRDGMFRESMRRLQLSRKEMALEYTDRVNARIYATAGLFEVLTAEREKLVRELLVDGLELVLGTPATGSAARVWEIGEETLGAEISRSASPAP